MLFEACHSMVESNCRVYRGGNARFVVLLLLILSACNMSITDLPECKQRQAFVSLLNHEQSHPAGHVSVEVMIMLLGIIIEFSSLVIFNSY